MVTVTLARHAMATRFELVLHGKSAVGLGAAGEEALAEVARIESRLSLYRPGSEIAQVNARAAREPVQVSPEVFALLQHAQRLSTETNGAFDITIAPLVRCWGFMGGMGKMPMPEEIAAAREVVGMRHVQLDDARRTVRFAREGVMLDLGAIGKGYAVEKAAEILREAGVTSALVHGGTSTIHAIGQPPDEPVWKIAIEQPPPEMKLTDFLAFKPMELRDKAMSVSAIWGRGFQAGGSHFGHVIDPQTGQPVDGALLSVVVLGSATETDALSTALLTLGSKGIEDMAESRAGVKAMVVEKGGSSLRVASTEGDWLHWPSETTLKGEKPV